MFKPNWFAAPSLWGRRTLSNLHLGSAPVIRRVLIECLLMLLGQMSGGSRSPNGFFSIGELIFSLGGSYATTVLVTGRSARWLRRLPWMLCFLLESALLFSQTLMGLLPFIGYALWKGASFSHSLQGWWRDLRLDAMVSTRCCTRPILDDPI